jgi:sugar lactone lactonase YvrE
VLGWVDPETGDHRRFELPTRPEIAPNFDHELVKSKASAPIYIDFDRDDNAWFVNLQTNQIGRIDPQNQMSLFEIEGFDTNNTRPINVFQGPDGFIWVTIEGDNSPSAENTQQSLGGIARFDPSTETFEAYPQKLSKGAGGVLGVKDNSVWFQYQEEALVRLMVDDLGRSDQQTFPLPDIGKRVMHRIAQGPDGNMWFTSLHADVVSRLVTDQQGLPVYGFDQTHTGDQYLSALPMEWTHLLQPESGYDSPDPLFLSPSAGDEVIATSRFWDRLTGQTVWTIDGDERNSWQSSCRYEWLGEDFRVYDDLSDASGLIPVYRALDADDASLLWYTDPCSVDASIHADSSVAWYAYAIPENATFG